ncbi:MAG: pyrroloquinoline quinone biosynthesis protein PqqE [Chitinophagaceae bacterium]|nr:pyrroloquinoline quinone biosynthesis protein PqqE [Oligoflexus sp.]
MITDGLNSGSKPPIPLWMLAELTYKCPLQCPYCSNPLAIAQSRGELSVDEWCDTLSQARALGAVQLGLSGGEPLLKGGVSQIIKHATDLGFYTNLITSGVGLTEKSIVALKSAGLEHIQLSVQAPEEVLNDQIAGRKCFREKLEAAALIKKHGFAMVMNVVLHRHNIGRLGELIELAVHLKADYLELANVQFDGWAYLNRKSLLPTRDQIDQALATTREYEKRMQGRLKIFYVLPDYYSDRPKACCNGWGSLSLVVSPSGFVMPCLGAHKLPIDDRPNIRDQSLGTIWRDSKLFNSFRGYDWMQEPCRSCPEKTKDFGGCRCQAFLLTGDASQTDPVCALSPKRSLVDTMLMEHEDVAVNQMVYRSLAESVRQCDR